MQCLVREIELRKQELKHETIETIYFGGGTPSLCSKEELELILDSIHKNFAVRPDCEITLEANPDDLFPGKIMDFKNSGINRLSIGIQSFYEEDLLWMNRAHNAQQAMDCIRLAQEAGISNISADLIFATPLLTQEKLEKNLTLLAQFNIPHISCYNLTVEEKTNLNHQIKTKKINVPSDEIAISQFYFIREFLQGQGYEHYEISNYAKPGGYSKHNTGYWQGKKYLGIGPAAHSYNGLTRNWNIPNNEKYIRALSEDKLVNETELYAENNRFNEVLLTGLRTKWGVNISQLQQEFPVLFKAIEKQMLQMISEGKLTLIKDELKIVPAYWVMADGLVSSLFVI